MNILRRIGLTVLLLGQLSFTGFAQASGVIRTLAGNGMPGFSGDGGPAATAQLNLPSGFAVDSAGNVYIADTGNQRIRKVTRAGVISTVAGNGATGFSGDGGPATAAKLNGPSSMAFDASGNLYFVDSVGYRVRKVTPDGIITTVFANVRLMQSIAIDPAGNLYIAEPHGGFIVGRITKVAPGGAISYMDLTEYPEFLATDSKGNLYVADGWVVIKMTPDGVLSTVAGNGTDGFSGDGGPATSARLDAYDIKIDQAGNLYIAGIYRIRRVTADGVINTVAGNGTKGYSGDGGPAVSAQLNYVYGIALDQAGNLYIADQENHRIRMVEDLAAVASYSTYFPQVAVGGGWSTLFTVTNTGSTLTSGKLILTDQQGNSLTANGQLTDSFGTTQPARSGSSFAFEVPPGGTVFLSTTAPGGGDVQKSGWGRLDATTDSLTALATFEYAVGASTLCMVGVLPTQSFASATIPVDNDYIQGKQVAYAIANPSSQAISVRLTLVGQDGTVVDDSTILNIGPGQQIARYLRSDLGRPKFRGSLVLRGQNGQTFVAVGLLEKQGHFIAIPLILGKAPGVPN